MSQTTLISFSFFVFSPTENPKVEILNTSTIVVNDSFLHDLYVDLDPL